MMYGFIKMFTRFICLLPLSVSKRLGDWLGELTWLIVPARRKALAYDNIMRALGMDKAEAMPIAKRSWTRFGRMLIEVMSLPKIKNDIGAYVTLRGEEYLRQAMNDGNGVVAATAHAGNWEILSSALALRGYPTVMVVQKQTNKEMDRIINEYRALGGVHITYKTGVREMARLLGEGYMIGLAMDQDAGKDGVMLDFFGRPASCPQGPAFLARMKRAPILPIFITEGKDGRHTILIHPPLHVMQTDCKADDIKNVTKRLTTIIEEHVREYPEEWFWLHNRWKSSPDAFDFVHE